MNIRYWPQKKDLLNKYDKFVFISPHLDDAVLSCSGLLLELRRLKKKVTVISVFTKCTKDALTPQAKKFIKTCGYKSGTKLFKDREKEDIRSLKYLGAKPVHLGFVDAAWRVDSRRKPIYESDSIQFSAKISVKDNTLIKGIEEKLNKYLSLKNALVLCPLGIGGHVDHAIVRDIVKRKYINPILWEDFPYGYYLSKPEYLLNLLKILLKNNYSFSVFAVSKKDVKERNAAISYYRSQTSSLFSGSSIPNATENYFSPRS